MNSVVFVGIKRKYREMDPKYWSKFDQFHAEFPYYYAMHGGLHVVTTTVDLPSDDCPIDVFIDDRGEPNGTFSHMSEDEFRASPMKPDVVVHWRRWFPDLYRPSAVNILHTCDFNYDAQWRLDVVDAFKSGKLYGLDCYPTWHKRELMNELNYEIQPERFFDDVLCGVDTTIYKPAAGKSPYEMLWASDPGRGLQGAIELTLKLFQLDRRFRLHVCWPDYVTNVQLPRHPAIVAHGNVQNGPALWSLFGQCGVLPYTSTFSEPYGRAWRQAMAAGSMVLYPPVMGSPSEMIENGRVGVVAPIEQWPGIIAKAAQDGSWKTMGDAAREHVSSQDWKTQARNFALLVDKLTEERKQCQST